MADETQSKVRSGEYLQTLKKSVLILMKALGISLKDVTSGRGCFNDKGVYFKTSDYKGFKVDVCEEKWVPGIFRDKTK